MSNGTKIPNRLSQIGIDDMADIALGGAFLGTGGGGDPYIGRLLAEQALREHGPVDVLAVDDLHDDDLIVPVAMMGAPTVMLEKLPQGDEANAALATLQMLIGKKARAVFCIEAGGLNSTIPIAVAATAGLPIVDGDGMGRAFPELQMVSMTLHDISACPMVMADEKGNSIVLNTVDNLSTEKFARAITVEMGGAGLIALYPMTGAQTKKAALQDSISLINSIGTIIHAEQAANRNPAQRLCDELAGVRLFEGRVMDVDRRTEGGFATPDLICLLYLETGQPITTEQIRYGFRVIVFGLPCNPQWCSDKGLELVGPRYFGYDLDYQPINDLNKFSSKLQGAQT